MHEAAPADEIASIIDNAIKATTEEQWKSGKAGYNIDQRKRYVYLDDTGWVDLQHVVSAAYNPFSNSGFGDLPGVGVEFQQLFYGSDSAFKMEDFRSNHIGASAAFAKSYGLDSRSLGQISQSMIMSRGSLTTDKTLLRLGGG